MHRIDGPGHVSNMFDPGDPLLGVDPTQVTADIMNAFQEEIANAIESTGQALNKADNTQLAQALSIVAGSSRQGNLLENGRFRWWQRQRSLTSTTIAPGASAFGPDRWRLIAGTNASTGIVFIEVRYPGGSVFPYVAGDPDVPKQYLRLSSFSTSSADDPRVEQNILDVRRVLGRTLTVSAILSCATGGPFVVRPRVALHPGVSSDVLYDGPDWSVTTTPQRFSWTVQIAETPDSLTIDTNDGSGQTVCNVCLQLQSSAGWTLNLADLRVDVSPVPLIGQNRSEAEELLRCLAYFESSFQGNTEDGAQLFRLPQPTKSRLVAYVDPTITTLEGISAKFAVAKARQNPTIRWWNTDQAAAVDAIDSIRYNGGDVDVSTGAGDRQGTGFPALTGAAAGGTDPVIAKADWSAEAEMDYVHSGAGLPRI